MTLDHASCYRALASRDARFDGRFFTGVTTTGIYCRPICPARTPSRANARFYPCATAAEADGFRPCRRCRPDAAPGTPAWHGAPTTVARGLRLIRDGALDEDGIDRFAERLGLSARHVRRLFETHLGAAPTDIARTRRVHFARTLLDDPSMRLTDIAFASGFQSVRQFNHAFRQTFDSAPRMLRPRALTASAKATASPPDSMTLRLGFRPPLDFDWLVRLLAGRAAPGVERVDGGVYRRTVAAGDAAGWIEIARPEGLRHRPEGLRHRPEGLRHRPEGPRRRSDLRYLQVRASASLAPQLMRVAAGVRRVFDLDADPATIQRALSADARLAAAIRTTPGLRVPGAWQPWEIALRAIAGQQVSVAAASTIVGRIVERAGKKVDTPFDGLSHLFPTPDAVAKADLSNIGMPSARTATVTRFAAGLADGSIRLEVAGSYEQTIRALCSIQGIGPWTAEYIALRALGEPDAFPAGDLGLRKALGNGTPATEKDVTAAAEAWRPWRGYAAMYLWNLGSKS